MQSVHVLISTKTTDIVNEVEYARRAARSVLKKAVEQKSELIVISADAPDGMLALFKQNYARFIINHSTLPVLSVK